MRFRLIVASIVLLQALLIQQFVAQRFPLSADDYSYLYQARLFASGRFYAEHVLYDYRHPLHACIETNCLRDEGGRRFSKYAPGWPLVLSLGVLLGAPWLVQPLIAAALSLMLLAYIRRAVGASAERVAGWLLIACVFWAYYGASYRPHTATALCVFAAFLAFERARNQNAPRAKWLVISVSLLGFSTLIRYTDWVPLGIWMAFVLFRSRHLRSMVIGGLVFACLAAGNLAYVWVLSGQIFAVPTHLGGSTGDHDRLDLSLNGILFTLARLAMLGWVFPPVLLLVRGWLDARGRQGSSQSAIAATDEGDREAKTETDWLQPSLRRDARLHLALFCAIVAVYALFGAAPAGPGPRYFLPYFPFLVAAVVSLHQRLVVNNGRGRALWRALIVAQVVGSAIFIARETYTLNGRRDVERTMDAARVSSNTAQASAVLLRTGTYHTDARDLTMNPPGLDAAKTLYFSNCGIDDVAALQAQFPNRKWFTYSYPGQLLEFE